jgi:hypothetical protein
MLRLVALHLLSLNVTQRLDGGGHSVEVRPSSVLASAEQRLGIRIVHFCLAAALSADWI